MTRSSTLSSPPLDSPTGASKDAPIKTLIVGATGFCGRAIARRLARDSRYHVTAHVRPGSSRYEVATRAWSAEGVSALSCAWGELPQHLTSDPPTIIISCIGITKRNARSSGATYSSVDSGLNLALIEASRGLSQPPLFVYISSAGVEWARWSAYLRARADVERALHERDLPHIILRPSFLAGPSRDESRPLERVGAALSLSLANLMERCGLRSLAWRLRPLDAPEVAEVIAALLKAHDAHMSSALDGSTPEGTPHQSVYELSALHQIRHARLG